MIDVVATGDPLTGSIAVALLNKARTAEATVQLRLSGEQLPGSASITVLGAPTVDSFNDIAHPLDIEPHVVEIDMPEGRITLPAHSVAIVSFVGPTRSDDLLTWPIGTAFGRPPRAASPS